MGLPINGPAYVFGDNKSVLINSSKPDSVLKKIIILLLIIMYVKGQQEMNRDLLISIQTKSKVIYWQSVYHLVRSESNTAKTGCIGSITIVYEGPVDFWVDYGQLGSELLGFIRCILFLFLFCNNIYVGCDNC